MKQSLLQLALCFVFAQKKISHAFSPSSITFTSIKRESTHIHQSNANDDVIDNILDNARRNMLTVLVVSGGICTTKAFPVAAEETNDEESFASIAARASSMVQSAPAPTNNSIRPTEKTCYDFSLPVQGKDVPFADIIGQEFFGDGETKNVKVRAIVVCNIKQDDVVARKTIPELIALASKYSPKSNTGERPLAIVCCPTDQGYYEPDTSALIRLKLSSEYGYGINPATVVSDKVNLLGTGAHPFWRWLQSICRTPAGLGRLQGNFEKFLLDGRTGLPVRRYPRRYAPLNLKEDIEAVLANRFLPPAKANWQEEWRQAAVEAERDTYRFEKGLNVFDQ